MEKYDPPVAKVHYEDPRYMFSDKNIIPYFIHVLVFEEFEGTDLANKYGILTAAMSDPTFTEKFYKIKKELSKYSTDALRLILARSIISKTKLSQTFYNIP